MSVSAALLRPRSLHGVLLTGFVALIHTTNDLFTTAFAALLPSLQARFELTEASVAVVVGALWMSASLMQPVFGSLACRMGRRTIAAAGLALTSVLLSLVAVVPAFYLLLPLVLLGGMGSAALHPVGTSISRSAGGTRPGLAVGVFGAAGELGFALGPVVMLYVVSRYGLAATPWLMLPGAALAALALVLIPKDPPTGNVCPAWLDTTLLRGPVGRLVGASVLINIAFITAMSAVPIWMVRTGALAVDSPLIAWTLFVFSLSAGAGAVLSGILDSPRTRVPLIVGSLLFSVLPLTGVLFVPPGSVAFFVLIGFAGMSLYASGPLVVVEAQDRAPTRDVSVAAMILGFSTGIAGLLYIGFGWLQDALGLEPAMLLGFSGLVPAALLIGATLRPKGSTLRA